MNVLVVLTSGWKLFVRDSFNFSGFVYYYFNWYVEASTPLNSGSDHGTSLAVPALYCVCKYLRKDKVIRLEDIDIRTELMLIQEERQKPETSYD